MRPEELMPELLKQAQKCETDEERMEFIKDNNIELSEEELDMVTGGKGIFGRRSQLIDIPPAYCKASPDKKHKYVLTGATRDGLIWTVRHRRCEYCGVEYWALGDGV